MSNSSAESAVPEAGDPLPLRFEIAHPGLTATQQSPRRRAALAHATKTAALAAAAIARWPHKPLHGPRAVSQAIVIIRRPARLADVDAQLTAALIVEILRQTVCTDAKVRLVSIVGRHRQPIGVEVAVVELVEVADVATRAAAAARTVDTYVRPALQPGEPTPAEEYERAGVRIAAPVDSIDQYLDEQEAAAARERSEDPNAITNATLQRETPLSGHSSNSKGNKAVDTPPTATELNASFDAQTRELGGVAPLSDLDRAKLALERNAEKIEAGPRAGRPLKGNALRIKIHGRVSADLLVACSALGPDIDSILLATAKAIREGTIYVPPENTVAC